MSKKLVELVRARNWTDANKEFARLVEEKMCVAIAEERTKVFEGPFGPCSKCGKDAVSFSGTCTKCGHTAGGSFDKPAYDKVKKENIVWGAKNEDMARDDDFYRCKNCGAKSTASYCDKCKDKAPDKSVKESLKEGVGNSRGAAGWITLKAIPSHSGHARFRMELGNGGDPIGWIVHPTDIPSPYSYSPSRSVYRWGTRNVIIMETKHKYYEVIAVPPGEPIYKSDDEATNAFVKRRGQ